MKKFLDKFVLAMRKAFYWIADKYVKAPLLLKYFGFAIIGSPAIFLFLGIWNALGGVLDEHSFGRWLLAVIPSISLLLGIVIGLSKVHNGSNPFLEDKDE